jgi:hypothetical protein
VFLGILMLVVGMFNGCGALFTWNGRHPIAVVPLPSTLSSLPAPPDVSGVGGEEAPVTHTLTPVPGRRYTLIVEAVFDREGLAKGADGVTIVEAKMPLVVRAKDGAGTSLAQVAGWLDPNEPPNVLYGQAAHESIHRRGPTADLSVTRLVGPFTAASASPITVEVSLGADRLGRAEVLSRRLVIHDDAVPGAIRNAFIVAGAGAVAFLAGLVVIAVEWFRRRTGGRRRKKAA